MVRRKKTDPPSSRLFADDQKDLFERFHEEKLIAEKNKPAKCLAMTSPNDIQSGKSADHSDISQDFPAS